MEQVSGFSLASVPRSIETSPGLHSVLLSLSKTLPKHTHPKAPHCLLRPLPFWAALALLHVGPCSCAVIGCLLSGGGPSGCQALRHICCGESYSALGFLLPLSQIGGISDPTCRAGAGQTGTPLAHNALLTFLKWKWIDTKFKCHRYYFLGGILLCNSNVWNVCHRLVSRSLSSALSVCLITPCFVTLQNQTSMCNNDDVTSQYFLSIFGNRLPQSVLIFLSSTKKQKN